ncbi:beta-ketoacyl synthase N-terminal-like domain-containing protein [Streptomyces cadmiisoli]|uniref:beta-ketoacyl [acyl carrier protein] synthase domain-containing protein n=1 Tax=Streptomyces cadmiisoli TaxID=2184053 RepID=UPI003D7288BA
MTDVEETDEDMQSAVAVIGMAARVPGVADLDEFWGALVSGRDLTTRLEGGAAYGVVAGTERFDAAFFGFGPRDAQLLDPQDRVFLECAREALEDAGQNPRTYPGAVGVYAGSGESEHLAVLRAQRHRFPEATDEQLRLAGSRDFLTGRVAYALNLQGPAVTVHTGCSTSLVAVHLACQALLAGDCDLALAGGVTVRGAAGAGEGDDLLSADGRCRPFDADADGMVAADGAGIVVLKRFSDALADGDQVEAVIRGSALSNDGSGKVSFTAPSVAGQVAAIRSAHLVADVCPDSIGYVEAHGTGTLIGDAMEVRALSEAFGQPGPSRRCVLSSVKSNIGHTDTAAGVIGLIKVVLALRHGLIPGTAHFRSPSPHLDLEAGGFVVTRDATPWPPGHGPRRAGVNATGIGGTNAHLLVEEAPTPDGAADEDRDHLPARAARTAPAGVDAAVWHGHRTGEERDSAAPAAEQDAGGGESGPATSVRDADESESQAPAAVRDASAAAAEARTPAEKVIAGVWSDVLGVADVGMDDDFFELGGHSLHATRVLARLGPALGSQARRLTVLDIFDHPTVRDLAALVSASGPR